MKSVKPTLIPGYTARTLYSLKPKSGRSLVQNVFAMWVTIFMAIAPITGAMADGGALAIQYEFSLNKKVRFRQVNLAYRNFSGLDATQSTYTGETARPGAVVPLYSMDTRSPGLINLLFGEKGRYTPGLNSNESNDSKKRSAGAALLLIGVLGGLTVYAVSEAQKSGCSDGEIGLSFVLGSDTEWCAD